MATQITFTIEGDPSKAVRALKQFEGQASKSSAKAQGSFSKLGGFFSKTGSQLGGEFGEILNKVGDGFDAIAEHGSGAFAKIAAGGAAVAATGATLTAFGAKRMQSENQLKAAIDASGHSYEEYAKQIDATIKTQENFGHQEGDTQEALMKLTAATQDPAKALKDMGLVANLAAAQHESLASAASQVARVYGGSGKVLKQYGITMESSKADTAALKAAETAHTGAITALSKAQEHLTQLEQVDHGKKKLTIGDQIALKNAHQAVAVAQSRVTTTTNTLAKATANSKTQTQTADAALGQLANRLHGQAAAASDTWTGKLDILRAKLGDFAAKIGQKYGPAITAVGTAMTAAGSIAQIFAARHAAAAAAAAEDAAATNAEAAAIEREGAAAAATSGELTGLAGARARAGGAAAAGAAEGEAGSLAGAGGAEAAGMGLGSAALALGAVAAAGALAGEAIQHFVFGAKNAKFDAFQNAMKGATKEAKNFADAVHQDGDHLGATAEAMIVAQAQANGLGASFGKAGISLADMTRGVAGSDQAFGQMVTSWRNSQHPSSDLVSKLYELRANYENGTTAAKKATAQQNAMNAALNALKPPPAFKIVAKDDATATIGSVRRALIALNGTTARTYLTIQESLNAPGGGFSSGRVEHQAVNAQGTGYFKAFAQGIGNLSLVGERGPEVVSVPNGSRVRTASETASLLGMGGSGGDTIEIHLHGILADEPAVERAVHRALETGLNHGNTLNIRSGAIRTHG